MHEYPVGQESFAGLIEESLDRALAGETVDTQRWLVGRKSRAFALDDEIWLERIPGHTPGHVAMHPASRGNVMRFFSTRLRGIISSKLL
jgi:glyoxylase-like metal-dependent hydrolase (beta-lactamase superfamily II)